MGKKYSTGKFSWEFGQDCHYENGYPMHKFLGPCPDCGRVTYNYGGGWRCVGDYCNRGVGNPADSVGKAPEWWNTDINIFLDGNAWCATRDGFINLQESNAGFGNTPHKAVLDLIEYESKEELPELA